MSNDYAALSEQIRAAELLDRQYAYYVIKFLFTSALVLSSFVILLTVHNFALQLLNSIFMAFAFVQTAAIFHDAVHQGIFSSRKLNSIVALITGNFILLISADAWNVRHSAHHSAPNHVDIDGDIDVPLLSYSEEQAIKKRGLSKFITKYQAYLWFFVLTLSAPSLRYNMCKKIFSKIFSRRWKYHLAELFLVMAGLVTYFGLIFYALVWWQAIIFIVLNNAVTGLYLGTIFATNHKGMPLLHDKIDFLRDQIITTRNVKSHPITDFWTGGLNYQIEHHLFPTMPRNNLGKASIIVKKFCKENSIPYYETGFFRSYKEILQYFHEVSAVLRTN